MALPILNKMDPVVHSRVLAHMSYFLTNSLMLDSEHFDVAVNAFCELAKNENYEQIATGSFMYETDEQFWDTRIWTSFLRPYNVSEGILTIPVQGLLRDRFTFSHPWLGTGYQYITRALDRALNDSQVKGIILEIHSPGGTKNQCFETCDRIFEARNQKMIVAVAQDYALSAAYAIASAAEEVAVSRSGHVGSIGTYVLRMDFSKALAANGVTPHFVFEGKRKLDSNPMTALTDKGRERLQAQVRKDHRMFLEQVARNREMSYSDVDATEALTYDSEDSIKVGLADTIMEWIEVQALMVEKLNR